MRTLLSAGWQLVITVVLIAALAMVPLLVVHRSQCVEDGERVDSWSVVAPWDDPPADCRGHQTGFEVLKEEVGL